MVAERGMRPARRHNIVVGLEIEWLIGEKRKEREAV